MKDNEEQQAKENRPACSVDSVSIKTISGHLRAHHPGTNCPGVQTNSQHQSFIRTVADFELLNGLQNLEVGLECLYLLC